MMSQSFESARAKILGFSAVTVRTRRTLLFGYFDADEFASNRTAARPGAFIHRVRDREFWRCNFYRNDKLRYSEAVEFYLQSRFHGFGVPRFEQYMAMWASSFYEARMDPGTVSNLLILFLQQNLEVLEHLYILERPEHQGISPSRSAIEACVHAVKRHDPIGRADFSKWTLEDWLPFHLRYFHGRDLFIDEF